MASGVKAPLLVARRATVKLSLPFHALFQHFLSQSFPCSLLPVMVVSIVNGHWNTNGFNVLIFSICLNRTFLSVLTGSVIFPIHILWHLTLASSGSILSIVLYASYLPRNGSTTENLYTFYVFIPVFREEFISFTQI